MQSLRDLPAEFVPRRLLIEASARWAVRARAIRPALSESAIGRKSDGSFVTAVDVAVQVLTLEFLSRLDQSPVLAEESADSLAAIPGGADIVMETVRALEPTADLRVEQLAGSLTRNPASGKEERFWILDPIDGTRSFVRGGHWCMCLALVERGAVEFAVNALPTIGSGVVQCALRERGSYEQELPMTGPTGWTRLTVAERVSSTVRIASAPKSNAAWRSRVLEAAAQAGICVEWIAAESQAKYASVARGDADLVLTPQTEGGAALWDHAGGALIAQEAGMRVESFDGSSVRWNEGRDVGMQGGLAVGAPDAMRLARSIAPRVTERSS